MPVLFGGHNLPSLVEIGLTLTDLAPPGTTFDLRRNSARGRLSLTGTVMLDCEGAMAPPDFATCLMAPPEMIFGLLRNPAPVSLTGTVTLDCEGAMAPLDFAR